MADESVHLADALRDAGFRHVIATQWTVQDDVAAAVTTGFFEAMRHYGFEPDAAAFALHYSIRDVRAKKPHSTSWAPFMHFGA